MKLHILGKGDSKVGDNDCYAIVEFRLGPVLELEFVREGLVDLFCLMWDIKHTDIKVLTEEEYKRE